jgi:hypothetical protein
MFPISQEAFNWLEAIFIERFGNEVHLVSTGGETKLQLDGKSGAIVFDTPVPGFSIANSDQHCSQWYPEKEGWKSVLGGPIPAPGVESFLSPVIERRGEDTYVHYDIPGLTYWMLARVEEIGRTDLDEHGRFPAVSSHAYKHGYLERPLVDEWLDILGQVIERQWPGMLIKSHRPKIIVSCDVDSPFSSGGTLVDYSRRLLGDLGKRRSLSLAIKTLRSYWYGRRGDLRFDTHRQGVDLIMDTNERLGNVVEFNFIPLRTHRRLDGRPNLQDPQIRKLLREINERGHQIGIHPGYETYNNQENMDLSVRVFRDCLNDLGIRQERLGGRQHYLRWETPTTACLWERNNLNYESTLTYADRPGFRCGTCFEYPMFDATNQKKVLLRQRPLIVMECTVIAKRYLGLGYSEQALEKMHTLKKSCYAVGGQFSILWHNSHFECDDDIKFYENILN